MRRAAPTHPTGPAARRATIPVRGPAGVLRLCRRCLVILFVVNAPLFVLPAFVTPDGAVGTTLVVAPFVVLVAAVPVLLVGYPAGRLLTELLKDEPRLGVHVLAFALVGAVLSVAICALVGWAPGGGLGWLVAAAEGAVGAGGARWWSGRPPRARRHPSDEEVEDGAATRAVTE